MTERSAQVAIIGAGITGIATAYYLSCRQDVKDILLIDVGQPMAFTSAQSGENYRNWWPHPVMVALTNRSIDLMEETAGATNNRINMNRRGYALSTRAADIDTLLNQLYAGLGTSANELIRVHERSHLNNYSAPVDAKWETAPVGVDILQNQDLIRKAFPGYDHEVQNIIHIRRGGDISGQQLGMYMLEVIKEEGGKQLLGTVENISHADHFKLEVAGPDGTETICADKIVNAAGPFADRIAKMLSIELPVFNTFQQKIAFEDIAKSIRRDMPFSIDLDDQLIDWTDEERVLLLEEAEYSWLANEMPGSVHCRPDGGDNGTWVKLGWAYNEKPEVASWDLPLNDQFPEIVLRGAARLNPALKIYYDHLPRSTHHYGGWYTMTAENWPLIGPMSQDGSYMNCAYSGFGTMAACAGGELCAAWVAGSNLPEYASNLSAERHQDSGLMQLLHESNKGVL